MSNDEMGRMLAAKMACQLEISKIDLTADGLRAMIPIMQEAGIIDKKMFGGGKQQTALAWACWRLDLALIRDLLTAGASPTAPSGAEEPPLMAAMAADGDLAARLPCLDLLFASGADVHQRNQFGQQAIHVAVRYLPGQELARWAISRGADPLSQWRRGSTLSHAVDANCVEGARMLVEAAAQGAQPGEAGDLKIREAIANTMTGRRCETASLIIEGLSAALERKAIAESAPVVKASARAPRI